MELREATTADVEEIREVAYASLAASYGHALTEDVLRTAVDRWYDPEELGEDIQTGETVFPVAVVDGSVAGFAESYVVDRRDRVGEIDWLHVHPDHRSAGIGTALLEQVEEELKTHDVVRIEGRVLAANEAGTTFYEHEGYEVVGERMVDIGHDTFPERLYRKALTKATPPVDPEMRTTADGETMYVAYDESSRGSDGPFYAVYADEAYEDRWGLLCGACDSLDVAVDTMDAVQCNACGNRRRPTRWDAAYL